MVGHRRSPPWAWAAAALVAWGCGDEFHSYSAEGGAPAVEAGSGGRAESGTVGGTPTGGTAAGQGATGGGGRPGSADSPGGAGTAAGPGEGGAGAEPGSTGGAAGTSGSSSVPLDGLELWFDARVGVSVTDGVLSWQDRSEHERHARQSAAARQPSLLADGLNGKPALAFDGVDDSLSIPELPGNFSAGLTIVAVGRTDSDNELCMGYFEASNGREIEDVHLGFWQKRYLFEVAEPYIHVDTQVLLEPEIVMGVQRPTGDVEGTGVAQLRRNGRVLGEKRFALPEAKVRDKVYLGNTEYAECKTLNGRLGEVLVYSRGLTSSEVTQLEAHLQQQWGCCGE